MDRNTVLFVIDALFAALDQKTAKNKLLNLAVKTIWAMAKQLAPSVVRQAKVAGLVAAKAAPKARKK